MALVAGVFIVAPDVRMSILAMGSPMRPHTLTQTDQNTSKSPLQTGRAIRFYAGYEGELGVAHNNGAGISMCKNIEH